MNENTKPHPDVDPVEDDMLDEYDFSKASRGNPHRHLSQSPIKIETSTGDREVKIKTVEVLAVVAPDGKVTLQLPSDISPGEHHMTLLIQENMR